jgi:hypothetical protein
MSEYLGEAVIHVDVRPVRAAYLVRGNSSRDFKRAVYHACGRWGGLREPIVPVSPTGRIAPGYRHLIDEILPPDMFIDLSGLSDDVRNKLQASLRKRVFPDRATVAESWDGHTFHPLGAHTANAIRDIDILMPEKPSLIDRTGTGWIEDAQERSQWNELGARVQLTRDAVDLAIAQLNARTVIATTLHQCGELLIENPFVMSQVWIAPPDSLRDCLEFWNLRAATPNTIERDYMIITTREAFSDARFREALVSALRVRPHTSTPTFLVRSLSVPRPQLEALVEATGFELYGGSQVTVSHHGGRGQRPPHPDKLSVGVNRNIGLPTRTLFGVRASPTVQLFSAGTRIRTASPLEAHPLYGWGPVRLRLSGAPQLRAPVSPSVARLFDPNAEWVSRELDLPIRHEATFDIPIALPDRRAILDAALGDRGITWRYSQPGKHAQAVLGRLKSPDLFLNPGVDKVISALTSQPPAKLLGELKLTYNLSEEQVSAILRRLDERPPRVEQKAKDIMHLTGIELAQVLSILDDLAFVGLVERGLVIDCSECGLHTFGLLKDVDSRAVCPACGARGVFAGDATGAQIYHRLNALLDRASAVGAIGHLYGAAAILRENRSALVIPGAEIHRPDKPLEEVDLVALIGDIILSGEVKQTAGRFTETQIERDMRLSSELGARRHLMVSLTPLPQDSIDFAAGLARKRHVGLALIHPPANRLEAVVRDFPDWQGST